MVGFLFIFCCPLNIVQGKQNSLGYQEEWFTGGVCFLFFPLSGFLFLWVVVFVNYKTKSQICKKNFVHSMQKNLEKIMGLDKCY